jgi:hypothetical protein
MRKLAIISFLLIASLNAQLQVSSRVSPVNDYQTSLAVPANQTVTINSLAASNTKLIGVDVWSSVAYKALIYTVVNSVQSTNPVAVGGAPAFSSFQWRTPDVVFVTLGSSGGTDNYQIKITNLDGASSADFFVSFHYSI